MLVGANEGLMLRTNLVEAKANMALAKLAGFRAVNLHAFWWPDVTEPREYDQQTLGNLAAASRLLGIPVFVAVTNTRGRYTPQDDDQRDAVRRVRQPTSPRTSPPSPGSSSATSRT